MGGVVNAAKSAAALYIPRRQDVFGFAQLPRVGAGHSPERLQIFV